MLTIYFRISRPLIANYYPSSTLSAVSIVRNYHRQKRSISHPTLTLSSVDVALTVVCHRFTNLRVSVSRSLLRRRFRNSKRQ